MMKVYMTILAMLVAGILQAQERVVSGQLKSGEDDSPLPGVNIVIKGTQIGTVTDRDGRYSISAPIGSVLVFSFIGLTTCEYEVTATGLERPGEAIVSQPRVSKGKWDPFALQDSLRDIDGVATIDARTPTYRTWAVPLVPEYITAIRRTLFGRGGEKYAIHSNTDLVPKGFSLQLSSMIGFDRVGKLPALQSIYAQGRNLNGGLIWRGPDQSEVMSWGPAVKTLEYTGNPYAYDVNGDIVTAGAGNGVPAKSYDPYDFFKTGITTQYEAIVLFPGISNSTTVMDVESRTGHGVLPGNEIRAYNASLNMKRIRVSPKLTADAALMLNSSNGKLMNRGSNFANIIGSVMRTAPTFDNSAGFGKNATNGNTNVYELPDGTVRSTAPESQDNPYGLASKLPDHEKMERLLSAFGWHYFEDHLDLTLGGSWERQKFNYLNGIYPGLATYVKGRRTERDEVSDAVAIKANGSWSFYDDHSKAKLSIGYQLRNERRSVSRTDGFNFTPEQFGDVGAADSLIAYGLKLDRLVNEATARVNWEYRGIETTIANRAYFSNTLSAKQYVNLFPSLTVKFRMTDELYMDPFTTFTPFVSVSRTIREAPLLFGNSAILSTMHPTAGYNRYFEDREIAWNSLLDPETEVKFETGLTVITYLPLTFDFTYYNNTTHGLIVPVMEQGQPVLQNTASVNNRGVNAMLEYSPAFYYGQDFNWSLSLRWAKYNSVVGSVDIPGDHIPVAGFREVRTVIAAGEPLGAIYGTTFVRDDLGRKVIDANGFPIVDPTLKKIGNPVPKYTITLEPRFQIIQRIQLGFIMDFKKGGQVWNGTAAVLNYVGIGELSGEERQVSNYVFDGVTAAGTVNTAPVSYYDPALPLDQNRWVRYGFGGVGEEYIEDASWVRMSEAQLTWRLNPAFGRKKSELLLSFIGKNLLLFARYSGVDPGTSLYSYRSGAGLDLFNAPSVRSYNFQITFKL